MSAIPCRSLLFLLLPLTIILQINFAAAEEAEENAADPQSFRALAVDAIENSAEAGREITASGETAVAPEQNESENTDGEQPSENASMADAASTETAAAESANEEEITQPVATFEVVKSEQDAREYRYLVLANKMRVLLISDPLAEKAAAALDIFIGHNQNPSERPGLAHFLEHMLFLGTEKYPQAGDYQAFINQHGGRYNAYTAAEHTNYFFEIDPAQLEPALDRFAQFFIAPLFDAGYIERERNAVHSEYRARINDDDRRTLDVYRQLLNPVHPAAGFSVGNLTTLAEAEEQSLRDELIAFYQNYYSAGLMAGVVLGRESLDELQLMAVSRFGRIADREVTLPATYPPLFTEGFLPASVSIEPKKELRQLSFLFPIPENPAYRDKKPFEYIAHLLGHEGEGSLLALLKELGWAEKLSAGRGFRNRYDGFFYITIDLTEKGIRARPQIPVLVMHVIRQLEARGLKDWRYEELQKMADINFRFQEKLPPLDTVRNLAQSMHLYEAGDVLRGDYLYAHYDEKLIRQCLSYLRETNLLLTLVAPNIEATAHSPYYQAPYSFVPHKVEDLEVKPAVRKRLFFPEPNIFIPARLIVKAPPLLPGPNEINAVETAAAPQRVVHSERNQGWFLQDQTFLVPKTHLYLRLKLPLVARDAQGAAQAHLFAALVRDQLNEFAYPAGIAGLNYSINANPRGLDLHIAGYSSRQGLLLNRITEAVRKGRFTPERFASLKAELIRNWRNQNKNSPYQVMLPQIAAMQFDPYWSDRTLADALEPKTFVQFQQFAAQMLRGGHLDSLHYGNLYQQEAIKLAILAEHQLLGVRTSKPPPGARVFQLDSEDKPWLYRYPLDHDDHIVLLYIQGLNDDPEDAAHMQLLRQILQPLFFDQLRTEKQLGYVVTVLPLVLRALEGSVFVVQSPATDEVKLADEIDRFLQNQQPFIAQKLKENQLALARRLREPARSQAEQADRFWESILLEDYEFNRRKKLAAAVEAVTPESLGKYYQRVALDANRRLWLASSRIAHTDEYQLVEDIRAYQAQQKSLIYR